jgi:hypothetical protein
MPVDGQTINARFLQAVTTKLLIWQKKTVYPFLPQSKTFFKVNDNTVALKLTFL